MVPPSRTRTPPTEKSKKGEGKKKIKKKKTKNERKKNRSGQQALPTREVVLFVFVEKRTAFGFDLRRAVWRAAAERPRCPGGPRCPPLAVFGYRPQKRSSLPPRAPRAGTPGRRGRGGNRRESGAFAPAPPGSGFPSFLGATPSPPGTGPGSGLGGKPPPGGGGPGLAPPPPGVKPMMSPPGTHGGGAARAGQPGGVLAPNVRLGPAAGPARDAGGGGDQSQKFKRDFGGGKSYKKRN